MPQLLPDRKKTPVPESGDVSLPQIFAALGGGLAAAAVFAVITKGGAGAYLFCFLSPLPLMIVSLGFGLRHGITAAIIAIGLLSIWPNPAFGLVYAALVAGPAILAAWLAIGAPFRGRERISAHASAAAVLGAALALALATIVAVSAATLRSGGFDEAINPLRAMAYMAIEELIRSQQPGEGLGDKLDMSPLSGFFVSVFGEKLDARQLSGLFVYVFPATLAAAALLSHSLNLWVAGRLARASGALARPWPDLARDFTLPRAVAIAFAAACALVALGDLPGEIALIVAETLGLALAIQGLAVADALLRGSRAGGVSLFIAYFLIGLFGWPILLFAAVGAADALFAFRSPRASAQARRGRDEATPSKTS